jgi:hypothetical protein
MNSKDLVACLLVLIATTATAEVHVWSNPGVEMWNTYPVEFPAVLEGVVSVELHMAGNSGASRGSCDTPDGGQYFEQPWAISLVLEDLAVAQVTDGSGPIDQDYDVTVAFELVEGQADWSFLEDGVTDVFFQATGVSLPMGYPWCMPLAPHDPTTDVLDIIVTTDSVATAGTCWSSIKALYR